MKWFKHDTDASIDAKLQELLLDYGASGYGLYWYCVELIAQNVNENNITFELEHDARIIARNLNLSLQETKDMMQKMIDLNLFSFSKNHKLACYALAKRLDQSMTSNPEFRALIKNVKENKVINHDEVMINHDLVMQEEKRREEIRLEENREEEIKDFDLFWKAYPKKEAKGQAEKAWDKANKSKLLPSIDLIIKSLEQYKQSKTVLDGFPKLLPSIDLIIKSLEQYKQSKTVLDGFPKNPATWINGKCWLDEFTPAPKRKAQTLAESNREAMDEYERIAKYGSDVIDGVLECD